MSIFRLLAPTERRSALALLALMLLAMVMETLGVGVVIPAIALLAENDPARGYSLIDVPAALQDWSRTQIVVAAIFSLVGLYGIKAVYLAFVAWYQARFVFSLQLSLSRRLFDGYLRQPYTFHLQRNSAQIIRNVVGETSQFSHVVTIPGMTLLSEGLVLIGICGLLLVIEPAGALVVMATVGFAGYIFYRLTRMRLLRWGEARHHHEGMRMQHLQQGLGGAKEVKLLGRESQFLALYVTHDAAVARVAQRQLILQALPRLWLEFLGVVGLSALVLTLLEQGRSLESIVPTLGLFAVAAFRLMPSVNKVMTSIQSLRYAEPVLRVLATELSSMEGVQPEGNVRPMTFSHVLKLENVCYTYPGANDAALKDICLTIRQGTSVGIMGGSGAGKTTLIDVILGLLTPDRGTVRVDGKDIQTNLRGWQNHIGYVPQNIYLIDDTLRNNVAFGLAPNQVDDGAVWRALRSAQLEEFARQLPEGLETFVGERGVRLSGGQRQRIGIARALYHDPGVLVLDEATNALDKTTERGVTDAVRALQGKKTVLIIAHRDSTIEHCDTIVRLAHGSVAETGHARALLAKTPTDTIKPSLKSK